MKNASATMSTTDEFRLSPEIVRDLDVDTATGQNVKGQTARKTISQ